MAWKYDAGTFPVLNTDRADNELRRVNATEATGIAIDPAANRFYFGNRDRPSQQTHLQYGNRSIPVWRGNSKKLETQLP